MKVTLYKNVKKFTLTSALKVDDLQLVEKTRPGALTITDDDGNSLFMISYREGANYIGANGITFGVKDANGCAVVSADLPDAEDGLAESVVDLISVATEHLKAFEEKLPGIVSGIREQRKALIDGITEA